MATILVIEDDEGLNRGISFTLSKEGFTVLSAQNLSQAKDLFHNSSINLILLDLNLPDGDGLTFCREIKSVSNLPVIMLTARDLETDEVIGFESGADDYITKPFSLAILKARVAARLRNSKIQNETRYQDDIIHLNSFSLISNNVKLCKENRKVYKKEEEIILSVTEFKILVLFMEHVGQVLMKEQILNAVWDIDANFVDENTLSVNIRRLRKKLEDNPSKPQLIKTVHGIGYIWNERNTANGK